jgi:hypothetical protein
MVNPGGIREYSRVPAGVHVASGDPAQSGIFPVEFPHSLSERFVVL